MGAWADLAKDNDLLKGLASRTLYSAGLQDLDFGRITAEMFTAAKGRVESLVLGGWREGVYDRKVEGVADTAVGDYATYDLFFDAAMANAGLSARLKRAAHYAALHAYAGENAMTEADRTAAEGRLERMMFEELRAFVSMASRVLSSARRVRPGGGFASVIDLYGTLDP